MSRVYHDPAAEREANDIGLKFAHSSDVVGDMSRTYGTDLSTVRIHNDASAHRQTAQRGVDAFSTGKDVFFARGAYDRNDPASRGLLAHELTHSLQQQNAVTISAPVGAAQGGLIDFFRRLFGRRRRPAIRTERDIQKQRRLTELDAEDAKFAQWGRDAVQEARDAELAQEMGVAEGGVAGPTQDDSHAFVDLSALLEQARAKGWKRYYGDTGQLEDFDSGIMENFFREASGSAVMEAVDPATGQKTWSVSTGMRSMESMMDVFNNHDEASVLRFLQPVMDFSVEDFTRRYPIHQMSVEQRQSVYGPATAELQTLIGVKQWGEKFGVPLLSEANRNRFNERMKQFIQVTSWLTKIIMSDGRTSMAQDLEMDLLTDKSGRRAYGAADFAGAVSEVNNRLSGGGEIVPYSEFQSVMGDVLGRGSNPEYQIDRLSWQITGLSYDKESKTVTTPVPLAELRRLAAGDEETLTAYADKLRGMSWRDENGKERRAAQYDADQDEFAAGFVSDFAYFGDMGNTAFLLQTFGKDFLNRQADRQDLNTRAALGMNTRMMLANRAQTPMQTQANLFVSQFGGRYDPDNLGARGTAVARPTWIKRQLLETQRYEQKPQQKNNRTYYTTQGAALADMITNAGKMDPTLLQTPQMRAMALQSFQQGFGQMLSEYDDADFTAMTSQTFRGNSSGELNAYNAILKANAGGLLNELSQLMQSGAERDDAMVDRCLNIICDHVENQGDTLHDMVLGGIQATQRSAHFQGRPDLQSKYMMNNLVLRVVAPQLAATDARFAGKLMSAVNTGTSPACERLRNLLVGR